MQRTSRGQQQEGAKLLLFLRSSSKSRGQSSTSSKKVEVWGALDFELLRRRSKFGSLQLRTSSKKSKIDPWTSKKNEEKKSAIALRLLRRRWKSDVEIRKINFFFFFGLLRSPGPSTSDFFEEDRSLGRPQPLTSSKKVKVWGAPNLSLLRRSRRFLLRPD